jgi:FixJ family two-component response regulator
MTRSIHIVDDDEALRDSLSVLMRTHHIHSYVYQTGDEFLKQDLSTLTSPILLDIRMPGKTGLDVLQDALSINAHLQFIMMSGHADIPTAVKAVKMGALDFLEKPFRDSLILPLIEQAQRLIDESLIKDREHYKKRQAFQRLTPREREVLTFLADGKSNKDIANALSLSVRTIETHRAHLMSKLNASSVSDVIKLHLLFK